MALSSEQRSFPEPDLDGLQGPTGEENVAPEREGRIARALRERLEAKRKARAAQYEAAGIASGEGKAGLRQRYRQIKNLIRVVRGATMVGTSLGDVFFSLGGLFLSLIGEWVVAKYQLIPGYKMFDPEDPFVFIDKILWYGGWAIILGALFLLAALLVVMVYLASNPQAATQVGSDLKNIGL